MEFIEKEVQDLMPGDYVVNIGVFERSERRKNYGSTDYYWLKFSRPTFNHGANPTKKLLCQKNPPQIIRLKGENDRGVTVD